MSVVKDRELLVNKAEEFSYKLITLLTQEIKPMSEEEDGLADCIYFLTHVTASLKARICIACAAFGKNFSIELLNAKGISEIIDSITNEILSNNISAINDVVDFVSTREPLEKDSSKVYSDNKNQSYENHLFPSDAFDLIMKSK